jgi:large subunit ribosomal protein L29
MKASELNAMKDSELLEKEKELRENVFRMKFKLATGDIEDSSQIRKAKKDIARVKTVLNGRNIEEK